MITKMHEECWLRTDAANERGKRTPLFGGCIAKGLHARSGAYIRQGETICDLSYNDCDVRLELQRKLNSESSKQLPRLCSERKTTTSRWKRSSQSRGIRLWRARIGAVWAEGG